MDHDRARYGKVASALQWLIGTALLAQIAFGLLLGEIAPRGTPSRGAVINRHKSVGIVHATLYTGMAVLPASGDIASNFSKYGVKFFGRELSSWGTDLPAVYAAFNLVHVVTGGALARLVVGHVPLALKHTWIDHDTAFARIWPWAAARNAADRAADITSRRPA